MTRLLLPANYLAAGLSGLKEKKRERIYQAIAWMAKRMKTFKKFRYVNVHSDYLKSLIGNDYSKCIKILLESGVLKEQPRREGGKRGRYKPGQFSIAYTIPCKERIEYLSNYEPKISKYFNETDPSDRTAMRQSEVLQTVSIPLPDKQCHDYREILRFNAKCRAGSVKTCAKSRRKTHAYIREHKRNRENALMDGKPIYEYDLSASFGYFVYSLIDNEDDRRLFKEFYEKGIYKLSSKLPDQAKKQFMQFLFGPTHGMGRIRKNNTFINPFTDYFFNNMPDTFWKIVALDGSNLSQILSIKESLIFNEFLIPKSAELDILCLNMYDGFAVNNVDSGAVLQKLLEDYMEGIVGLKPKFKMKGKTSIIYTEEQTARIAQLKDLGIADNHIENIINNEKLV